MNYQLVLIFVFAGLGLSILGIYFFLKLRQKEKLSKIQQMPFKSEYREFLQKTPHYKNLSVAEKEKIERSILRFSYTKEFMGIGMEVTDEMKVVISFYACLLLLKIQTDNCYEDLKTIIIYPTAVMTNKESYEGGIYSKEQLWIVGQSSNDTVVLIWDDAKREAYHPGHENVMVHEFAHEIDFMDGEIDGVPPMEKSKYREWASILFHDYKELQTIARNNRNWGRYKLIGSYAATNEAEFFAVISERFFESPHIFDAKFPELYKELQGFYKIDAKQLVAQNK
jgi:hypothetical protein